MATGRCAIGTGRSNVCFRGIMKFRQWPLATILAFSANLTANEPGRTQVLLEPALRTVESDSLLQD